MIVMKFGGSSLRSAEALARVADIIVAHAAPPGRRPVVVVSAMGDTTDELTSLAHQVSDRPDLRELDVLLSTGELVSCTLMARDAF